MSYWAWYLEHRKMNRKNYSNEVTDKGFTIQLDDSPNAISRSLVFDNNGELWVYDPVDEPGFGFV